MIMMLNIDPTVVHFQCGSTNAMCWKPVHPSLSMHYHSLLSPTLEHAQRSHGQYLPSMVCGIEIIGDHNPENNSNNN